MPEMSERTLFEVFAEAIEAENKAGELYERAAAMCGSSASLAEMFRRLAGQERTHEAELFGAYAEFKKTLQAGAPAATLRAAG